MTDDVVAFEKKGPDLVHNVHGANCGCKRILKFVFF